MWFGKVCTAVLFAGLLVLFLFPHLPLFLGKQPDPGDDGSDDFYSFKLYSRLQADETGGRRAEGRIAAFKECQRLLPFILELCDLV